MVAINFTKRISTVGNNRPKWAFACMHCGFKTTYEVVSDQYWPECLNYRERCTWLRMLPHLRSFFLHGGLPPL